MRFGLTGGKIFPIMPDMNSVTDILAIWPSRQALADEIGAPVQNVHKWAQHQSIPAKYDVAIVEAAKARGVALDFEAIARIRAAAMGAA